MCTVGTQCPKYFHNAVVFKILVSLHVFRTFQIDSEDIAETVVECYIIVLFLHFLSLYLQKIKKKAHPMLSF